MFSVCPTDLQVILWKYTHRDIKIRSRLRIGEAQAHHIQQFQTIGIHLSAMFSTDDSGVPEVTEADIPQNMADAQAKFSSVFGKPK